MCTNVYDNPCVSVFKIHITHTYNLTLITIEYIQYIRIYYNIIPQRPLSRQTLDNIRPSSTHIHILCVYISLYIYIYVYTYNNIDAHIIATCIKLMPGVCGCTLYMYVCIYIFTRSNGVVLACDRSRRRSKTQQPQNFNSLCVYVCGNGLTLPRKKCFLRGSAAKSSWEIVFGTTLTHPLFAFNPYPSPVYVIINSKI